MKEVLKMARGEDGERKRENARALGNALAKGWDANGVHWAELEKITRLLSD